MRLKNEKTGDVLEVPPPNEMGESVIKFNGRVVERVLYSDETNSVTLGNGIVFRAGTGFANYVIGKLEDGSYGNHRQHNL